MIIRCANCGQEHYTRPIVDAKEGVMIWQWRAVRVDGGPLLLKFLDLLSDRFRAQLTYEQLIEGLWPDPDRSPDYAYDNLRKYGHQARTRVLPRLGLEIVTAFAQGYTLRPITPEAPRCQQADQSKVLEFA